MLWFFIIVFAMAIVAATLLTLPIFRVRAESVEEDQRRHQNIAMARERMSQLKLQEENGLVDPVQAEQERSEIELGLLDDVDAGNGGSNTTRNRKGFWAGIAVAVSTPFLAGMLYLVLGQPAALIQGEFGLGALSGQPDGHAEVDITTLVQRLEQKLSQSPEDAEGWYMLATSYMATERYDEAASAYETLRKLVGDEPDLLVREADALAMANDSVLAGAPEELLLRALDVNPNHPVALWMAGIAAEGRGDLEEALEYWEKAQPLFSEIPQSQAELQAMMERARVRLDGGTVSPEIVERQGVASAATELDATTSSSIRVRVTLDASLSSEVAGSDTLFVLARAVDGPPMPLAVMRTRADELPLVVTLDDSMAMMSTMNLSSREQVTVVAKLSKSGEPITQSGDLFGEMSPVSPGDPNLVNVIISKIAP